LNERRGGNQGNQLGRRRTSEKNEYTDERACQITALWITALWITALWIAALWITAL